MKYWLDALLGRLTMYRVVVFGLVAIYLTGLTLSLSGSVSFTPQAMLMSAGVSMAATYASSRLFGWLFGVRPHGESSLITALILFFLFMPTTEFATLVNLALVAMIASASKYLLAIRGRHVFNPVAAAAVVASVSGLAFATWWVATPVLLPVTALAAFAVLYKTRRLTLGAVFLAIAIPLVIWRVQLDGLAFPAAVSSLASWPMIFFVGFMLSEPLTLPPRRNQQLLVAVVVAGLFAWSPHLGQFAVTPPVALLVGNAIAFCFGQQRQIRLTYSGRRQLTPSNQELLFTSATPVRFAAGQYMELSLPHHKQDTRGARRIFSLASSPEDTELRFGIKVPEAPSSFKRALLRLTPGQVITATGIAGDFILPRDTQAPLLLVAGGIGITPFISHLQSFSTGESPRDIVLIYAVNSEVEIAYRQELLAANIPVVIVCPLPVRNLPAHWRHISGGALTPEVLRHEHATLLARQAYVSGPPLMVESTKASLRALGVRHIKSDYFTGY